LISSVISARTRARIEAAGVDCSVMEVILSYESTALDRVHRS
jgi:hypothetical protein